MLKKLFIITVFTAILGAGASFALKAPHSNTGQYNVFCSNCHVNPSTSPPGFYALTSFETMCLNSQAGCHNANPGAKPDASRKSLAPRNASNRFGSLPTVEGAKQSSHGWKIPNTNPDAGVTQMWAPMREFGDSPALNLKSKIYCTRCHRAHGDYGPKGEAIYKSFLKADPKGDNICFQCHAARRISNVRDAKASDKHYSHPVDVNYSSVQASKPDRFEKTPLNPYSSNPSAALKLYTTYNGTKGAVICSTCHGPIHSSDSNPYTMDNISTYSKTGNYSTSAGNLLRRYPATRSNDLCLSCHKVRSHRDYLCSRCHAPHKKANENNRYLIHENISTPYSGKRAVLFVSTSEMARRWTSGSSAICQVCHTATKFHRNYSTTAARRDHNYLGGDKYKFCANCHSHTQGFLPEPIGNQACSTVGCHDDYFSQMNTANKGYHHYLDNADVTNLASGSKYPVINPPTLGGTSDKNRRCLMCHVEHDIFKPELNPNHSLGRSYNLRTDIGYLPNRTTAGVNTDFISKYGPYSSYLKNGVAPNGGICLSCHRNSQTKSYIQPDGTTKTPVINRTMFDDSPHNYIADSTFDNGATVFNANCSKCHVDTMNKSKQGVGNQFGPHYSVIRRLNALMINENNTGTVSAATSTTLVDSAKNWGADIWAYRTVTILEGAGAGQMARNITGNTSTTLTVSPAWSTTPDSTSKYLIGESRGIDSGFATGATSTTLSDSTKAWTANYWANRPVTIISGTGYGQTRKIISNTATGLTIEAASPWTTLPDSSSNYSIGDPEEEELCFRCHSRQTNPNAASKLDYYGVKSFDNSKVLKMEELMYGNGEMGQGSGSGATFTASGVSWTTDQWAGQQVRIIAGTGEGQVATVTANTSNQLTVTPAWSASPSGYFYVGAGSPFRHRVEKYFAKHRGDEAENAPASGTAAGWINDPNTTGGLHTGCADCHNPHGNRKPGEDSGKATRGTGSTLTDTTKNWGPDQWRGYTLKLADGAGKGQNAMIAFNTSTTIHVGITYVTPPASGTYYYISPVGMPDKGNNLWNPNSGQWGVSATYSTTPPINALEGPVFTKNKNLAGGSNKIYELCFKCHSEYGWGTEGTPFTIPDSLGSTYGSYVEDRSTNIAQEFNPKNLGHHPVIDIGNNQPINPFGDDISKSYIAGPFIASGGSTSAVNYTNPWTPSKYSGQCVEITSGTGSGQIRSISSHTTSSITVDPAFSTSPDATSEFYIRKCSIYNTGAYGGGTAWPRFTGGTISFTAGSPTATISGLTNGIPSTVLNGWYLYAGALKTGADGNDNPSAGSCTTTAKCPPMLATRGWFQVKGISPQASASGTTTVTLTLSPTPTAGYSGSYALSAGLGNTFIPPYGPWSVIGCADCHDSASPEEPQGPHASSRQWILKTLEAQSFAWFYGGVDGSTTTSDAAQVKMVGYPAGDDSGWELNNVKYTCLNCHRADVYGSEGKSPAFSKPLGAYNSTCGFCHGIEEPSGPPPSGSSFTNFAWRPMSRLVHIPTGFIGYGGYAANPYGISCMNCHGGDNRVNKDRDVSDPAYAALGGIHGSNLGVGTGGTTSFRGRRLLNGAVWRGVTRATTGLGVTCSYQGTDSVNNCSNTAVNPADYMEPVDGGTFWNSGAVAAYPYYSGSDIYLPVMTSAVANNLPGGGNGSGAGDTVVIKFDGETNAPTINAGNIATALSLANGHSWKDGSGAIGSATWSTTTYTNDTLTITMSANGGIPTVAVGDVITSGATIKTLAGTPITNSVAITGTFDLKLNKAEAKDGSGGGIGIQTGDQVVVQFDSSTGGTAINAGNINSALSLNNGHSWLDGSGAISGAVWSSTTYANDTLTITLSANTSEPTVAKSDTITLGTVIKDIGGQTISGSVMIIGSFDSILPGTGKVPAGWWKFNENSGSTTYDESTNNNHGTKNVAAWTTGKFGSSAVDFGSTSNNYYVEVPDSDSLDLAAQGTLEAWVYPTSQTYRPTIISKGTSNAYMLTSGYSNGKVVVRWGNNSDDLTSSAALSLNQWSHVATTYDGAFLKIYINGQLDNSRAYTTNAISNTSPLLIGAAYTSGSGGYAFGGKIDEVAVYGTALTAEEVRQRYGARFTGAAASDSSGLGMGIQAGDQVVIKFDGATNGASINASNIDLALALNNAHSWKDGNGAIVGAVWSTTTYADDTLTISLSANTSAPTVAVGDTITLDGTIRDSLNRPVTDAKTISGGFDVPYGSVAYWTFNEATGNTIYDGTSNANNATRSTGTRVTAGYSGNAVGNSGGLNVYAASSNSLNLTSAGTIELWTKKNSNTNNQTYVSKGNTTQYQLMESGTTGKLALRWGHNVEDIVSNSVLPTGKWSHIVATYDGASLNLYINGQLDKTVAYTTNAVANSSQVNIGSGPSGTNPLDGMIDQVVIYNYALNATEARNRYKIRLDSAVAVDTSTQGLGIQAGDTVTIKFKGATNGLPTITSANIDTVLALNGGHVWGSSSGSWSTTTYSNDTLTITLGGSSTVGTGDAITLDGSILNGMGDPIVDSINISGTFGTSSPATPNATGYWKMDEGSGATIGDATGNGNTGTIMGASWSGSGRYGKALSFDAGQYVTMSANNTISGISSAITLEAWVYHTSLSTSVQRYLTAPGEKAGIQYSGTSSKPLQFHINIDGVQYTLNPSGSLSANTWNHVVGTYDGTTQILYLNGSQIASQTVYGSLVTTAGSAYISSAAESMKGMLDEAAVYNRALSSAEVLARYGAWLTGAVAGDTANNAKGIQAGDKVVISFNRPTNGGIIDASNIDAALALNGGHSWKDGNNAIGSAVWSTTANSNDTLTVTLSASAGTPTVGPGDTITLGGVIKDTVGRGINDAMAISGNFGTDPNEPLGAVGNWKFSENTGTTTADSTANGNTGTLSGSSIPTWSAGRYSSGLSFNGSTGYVNVPDSNSLDLITEGSVEAWVKMNGSNNYKMILSKGTAYKLYIDSSGKAAFMWGSKTITSTTALETTKWHHLVGTYKAGSLKLYIDGASAATTVTGGSSIVADASDVKIGTDGTNFFNGWIDEVVVYNREMSSSDVQSRYGSWLSSAVAGDTINNAKGIQTGDQVTIKFTAATNGAASGLTTANIDTVLNIGHSWGSVSSVAWSSTANANDTLTVTLNTGATVLVGDIITTNGDIKDAVGRGIVDSIDISGNFGADPNEPVGAVGNWKFNENAGATAADFTVNGNTGTLSGLTIPTWATGRYLYGLSFDGSTGHVNVPDSNSLDLTTEGSLEAWVKMNGSNNSRVILSKGAAYKLAVNSTGKIAFTWDSKTITSSSALEQTKWHHIVGTFKAGNLNLYIDGASAATTVAGGTYITANTSDLKIGTDGSYFFKGWIDEVVVYNKEISLSEVQSRYGTWLSSAVAGDTTNNAKGIQTGDQVIIKFTSATNGPAGGLTAANIDTILNIGHSWGSVSSVAWSNNPNANDTLTVTLNTGATVGIGDTVTLNGAIKDALNRGIEDSIIISGNFGADSNEPVGAVGNWKFDENTGITAADSTANGNAGTLSGSVIPSWTTGKYSYGLFFDGSTGYVNVPDSNSLDLTTEGSFEAWVKMNGSNNNKVILSKGAAYKLAVNSTGRIAFTWDSKTITSTAALEQTKWHHIVGTFKAGNLNLYIDGASAATTVTGGTSIPANALDLKIGTDGTYFFNGRIDEVVIYNREVSLSEVRSRYGTMLSSAVAGDTTIVGNGVQGGDQVVVTFSSATNGQTISAANIDTALGLSGGHSWRDGSGAIGSAIWSSSSSSNDTLTITLSGNVSLPTIANGDTITLDGTIKDSLNRPIVDSVTITGGFNVPVDTLGYWKFEEGSGYTVSDETVNAFNGTAYHNATPQGAWTAGKFGSAISLNGSADFVAYPNNSAFNLPGSYTIEAWIKPAEFKDDEAILFNGDGTAFRYNFAVYSDGKLGFSYLNSGSYTGRNIAKSTGSLILNEWNHVAVTRNGGSGSTATFYINGVASGTFTDNHNETSSPTRIWTGKSAIGSAQPVFFNGAIDEMIIFSRALSATDIKTRYHTWMKSAKASDASAGGHGIQANDQVVIIFDGATNGPAINSGNIDSVLALNNGHSWGSITSAWTSNPNTNDTLTIILPAAGSTASPGDIITLDGVTIKDNILRPITGSATLVGTFSAMPGQGKGYWELNEASGTIIVDGTSNGNHGTVYSAARVAGKLGNALSFNGSTDYAEMTNTNFSLANAISIEFWMKAAPQPIGMGIVFGNAFGIKTAESNLINPGVITTNGWQGSGWALGTNLFDNNWHHLVLTWDGTTQIFYEDGVAIGSATGSGTLASQTTMRLGNQLGGSYFFNGIIDEVVICNKALTPGEVANRFNNP